MRQAQNAKRARGRSRKVVNQLSRTMDSSGPDVKIRGTPSHIYEKYQTLARDANSCGDRIMAENYLQHAEHYLRLINALQAPSGREAQPGAANGRSYEATDEEAAAVAPAPQPAQEQPAQPAQAAPAAAPTRGRGRRRASPATAQSATPPPAAEAESPELPLIDQDAGAQTARA